MKARKRGFIEIDNARIINLDKICEIDFSYNKDGTRNYIFRANDDNYKLSDADYRSVENFLSEIIPYSGDCHIVVILEVGENDFQIEKHNIVGWYKGTHARSEMHLEPVTPTFCGIANRHIVLISRPDGMYEQNYVGSYKSIDDAIEEFKNDCKKDLVSK